MCWEAGIEAGVLHLACNYFPQRAHKKTSWPSQTLISMVSRALPGWQYSNQLPWYNKQKAQSLSPWYAGLCGTCSVTAKCQCCCRAPFPLAVSRVPNKPFPWGKRQICFSSGRHRQFLNADGDAVATPATNWERTLYAHIGLRCAASLLAVSRCSVSQLLSIIATTKSQSSLN